MQESEEIMAKTSKFENTLMDIADFVDSNVYLRSIKDSPIMFRLSLQVLLVRC